MKRKVSALLLIVFIFQAFFAFAEEKSEQIEQVPIDISSQATLAPATQASTPQPSSLPSSTPIPTPAPTPLPLRIDAKVAITGGHDLVYIGDKLYVDMTVSNFGDEFTCTARWLINGNPAFGFSNENFRVTDGKTSTFVRDMTLDYWNWGSITIGFELVYQEKVIARTDKEIVIKNIPYSDEAITRVLDLVKPVRVEAKLIRSSKLYKDVDLKNAVGTVNNGTNAICVNSKTNFSNKISLPDGRTGWVPVTALSISTKNYTNYTDLSNIEKDIFVNAKGYESKTDYLIWINLERQMANVYLGHKGRWQIEKVFPCGTGKNTTPTIQGVFSYYEKQKSWPYSSYYVGPIMIFSGNYAMHSVLMNYDGTIHDGTVGRPVSNGCVRLLPDDIDWLVNYVPLETTVVVY